MSWSFSIGPTPTDDWEAAVDAATPSPPIPEGDDTYAACAAAAKDALRALAKLVPDPFLTGSASGHVPNSNQGDWASTTCSVNVSTATAPEGYELAT